MLQYEACSLDSAKFQSLVERPSKLQIYELAELLAEDLESLEGEFAEDDPVLDWPLDAKGLVPIVTKRLGKQDWYSDLSTVAKELWEGVFVSAISLAEECDVDCRLETDVVTDGLIELASNELKKLSSNQPKLFEFGLRPFRCPSSAIDLVEWEPIHSVHATAEVVAIKSELDQVAVKIRANKDVNLVRQFDELLAALERVIRDGRMLLVRQ